jgi:HEAT repeat protein
MDRVSAAHAIGRIADLSAVEPLLKFLGNGKPHVASAAALALAKIKDTRAVAPLIALLRSGDSDGRGTVGVALASLNDPKAIDPLFEYLKNATAGEKASAEIALAQIQDPDVVDRLVKVLKDPSSASQVRQIAVSALGLRADRSIVALLLELLEDRDSEVKAAAAWAIASSLKIVHYPYPRPLYGDADYAYSNPGPRKAGTSALDPVDFAPAVGPLVKLIEGPNPRIEAVVALSDLKDPDSVDRLIRLLGDRDLKLRNWIERFGVDVAEALGGIKGRATVTRLIEALDHRDKYVVDNTAFALGRTKDPMPSPRWSSSCAIRTLSLGARRHARWATSGLRQRRWARSRTAGQLNRWRSASTTPKRVSATRPRWPSARSEISGASMRLSNG